MMSSPPFCCDHSGIAASARNNKEPRKSDILLLSGIMPPVLTPGKRPVCSADLLFFPLVLEVVEGDVVLADHLREVPVGLHFQLAEAVPGFAVSLRIIDGDVDPQLVLCRARDALDDVQLVGVRKPGAVD